MQAVKGRGLLIQTSGVREGASESDPGLLHSLPKATHRTLSETRGHPSGSQPPCTFPLKPSLSQNPAGLPLRALLPHRPQGRSDIHRVLSRHPAAGSAQGPSSSDGSTRHPHPCALAVNSHASRLWARRSASSPTIQSIAVVPPLLQRFPREGCPAPLSTCAIKYVFFKAH